MNVLLLIAGLLSILLGLAHSLLGERLIFKGWRKTPPAIPRRHQNIIWASWHIGSFLGFGIGGALIWLSHFPDWTSGLAPMLMSLFVGFVLSGLIVLYGTRGKHPGWIVLLAIAALTLLSTRL
ncbi:MAG: hypothetical protein ABJN69_04280 [Hellea sp.]